MKLVGVPRYGPERASRRLRSRPDRAGRAAPPARAARAAGRGRATAPARAARRAACRPRTCTSRCSRRGGTRRTATRSASRRRRGRARASRRPCSSRFSAGRSNTSWRHSRYVSRMTGNEPYLRATWSSDCAFSRCCQSGVRSPGRRRGINSARAAFSRNRAPKSARLPHLLRRRAPRARPARCSRSSVGGGASASGRWNAMPSSDQIDCTSRPSESRSRAATASAHGACTRAPNGVRMQTRQSPISSRKRSTTTVAVGGDGAGRGLLVAQEAQQVARRALVQHSSPCSRVERLRVAETEQLARELADRGAELVRAADALALPERHRAGHARSRRDEHPVARDLLDAPGRRAEQERLPRPRLVDHLLVELSDAAAAVDEVHAVEAAVGDRAAVRHREPRDARPPADRRRRSGPR